MPTNLPPEALDKWAEVEAAHGPKQKLQKMQEFLACVPQHKGTMKLRGQIKKKMAVIRNDLEDKKRKGTGKGSGGPKLFIEKEGTAQIALVVVRWRRWSWFWVSWRRRGCSWLSRRGRWILTAGTLVLRCGLCCLGSFWARRCGRW